MDARQEAIAAQHQRSRGGQDARPRSWKSSTKRCWNRAGRRPAQLKDEAAKIGEQLRKELRQQGEEEYRRLVERASPDIDASARRAAEELRAQVAGLVIVVVERVLGEGITLSDQEQLVRRAIADIEAQAASGEQAQLGPVVGRARERREPP